MLHRSEPLEVDPSHPFAGDRLRRRPAIENLTKLILTLEGPAVLSIDAAWGCGKTTFIRMWRAHLDQQGIRSVLFNAWDADAANDPMLSFAKVIDAALPGDGSNGSLVQDAAKVLGTIVARGAELGTFGLFRATDLEDEVATQGTPEAVAEARIAAHDYELRVLGELREHLAERASRLAAADDVSGPLVVFVDELDRCRPDFSVELLERVKHLFGVKGMVFVLGINQAELAHSVRAIYGSGFGAERYLGRFIDLTYHLPDAHLTDFVEGWMAGVGWSTQGYWPPDLKTDEPILGLANLASGLGLAPREVQQALAELKVVLEIASPIVREALSPAVAFLLFIRRTERDWYDRYVSGVANVSELVQLGGNSFRESPFGWLAEAGLLLAMDNRDQCNELRESHRLHVNRLHELRRSGGGPGSDKELEASEAWIDSRDGSVAELTDILMQRMGTENRQSASLVRGLLDFGGNLTFPQVVQVGGEVTVGVRLGD